MINKRDSIVKTALDIGNMKIKAVIGELSSDGSQLKVLGYAEVPSRGMKKSVIENPEELSQCVAYALGQLRDQTGENIEKVAIGISGEAIKSRTTNMKYQFEEKEITEKEVETLFRMSAHELLSGKERILKKEIYNIRVNNSGIIKNPIGTVGKEIQGDVHLIYIDEAEVEKLERILKKEIYNIRVNNSGIIKNPIGTVGKEIQGDVHLIYIDEAEVEKLVEVVNRAGVEVEHMLLNAYASAKAVLDDEDRRMGVALIDIGEGSTDIILFKNDKLIYTKSLPLGGMHYVNDISYLFQISKQEAFEILSKLRDKEIHDAHIYCGTSKKVAVDDIKNIIDARTGDIINFIAQTIEESGFNGYLGKGLVLTGGAVVIDGLLDKINKKTGYVVRKVLPTAFRGLEDVDSSQATVIGIFTDQTIEESGFNGYLGKGLVLTGGAVVIDGLLDKINKKTGYVVRKVLPTAFRGLEDVDSSQATVIGIFTEVMEDEYNKIQIKLNSPEPEIQEKVEENVEENLENLEKILEEAQVKEKTEKKDGVMKGIKSWFSNFI